ncbi:amino acid/polyamine/organocation transporter (APC superfamily) [Kribbella pratensis]|uniref:Amino acid/polyamine/organocation transporter (APC superfamily) n=1 Tax=Kribbella pratensis TaxID=2512112 RepID=A0A4R8CM08_9ACTN|nr:amino acid/polyamine/organocation transporter (APC superfamily) [Kribbella pratensis]
MLELPKRFLVGRPLRSERLGDTLLPKRLALPVFCSDPLSSNAYATEEILLMLSLGGLTLLHLTPWLAAVVIALLIVVVASYRQTCYAYPNGGGAYAVSRANLGRNASLVAASALLVDYVLTVAVSVAAGVQNIVSAVPALGPHAVLVSIGMIALLAVMNLRGVKESGTAFAIPTYGFIAVVLAMIAVGLVKVVIGDPPRAESAPYGITQASHATGLVAVLIGMRAFASGCTALTGVEAVSNGVPNFKPPKSKNAAGTLAIMGSITIAMFAGITALAIVSQVHVAADPARLTGTPAGYDQRTVIAQVAGSVFGGYHSIGFFAVQAFTAAILILAANTAFNGFPILASLLGHDGFLPRQFSRRGDRLVFSNGILILSGLACLLIWLFDASTTRLIQLYIIGVFVSFTLSQAGMVVHWTRLLRGDVLSPSRTHLQRSRAINALGAVFTAVILVVVLITKFTHGAWIVVLAMPGLFLLMKGIRRHYDRVEVELRPTPGGTTLPPRVFAIVLVSKLHTPTLRALAYARATRPTTLTAVTVSTDLAASDALLQEWSDRDIPVPLKVLHSPYRDVTGPVLEYVKDVRRTSPRDLVAVFIPEYVVGHWWEALLHNQSALRLKARLLFQPGVMVINVPWQLGSAEGLESRRVETAAEDDLPSVHV